MSTQPIACFGFYAGSQSTVCSTCDASRRCKAILVSDGFDILGSLVNQMITELEPARYNDTDSISNLVKQLREPPRHLTAEQEQILAGISSAPTSGGTDAVADIDIG